MKIAHRMRILFVIGWMLVFPSVAPSAHAPRLLTGQTPARSEFVLTITADNLNRTYGDAIPAYPFSYSGFVGNDTPEDIDALPTCTVKGPHKDVGTYPIVCSGGVDEKYSFTYVDGILTVTQKALAITADKLGKTYGYPYTFSGTEFWTSGLIYTDTVTGVNLYCAGAGMAAPNGVYPVVPSAAVGAGLGNYTISYNNGTMTVGGNILTISANNQNKTYGEPLTFAGNEFTATGLAAGDHIDSVTFFSPGAAADANAGTSQIIPSNAAGVGLGNYNIIYHNGQMKVNARDLTFTPDAKTKVYGQVFAFYSGKFTGLTSFDNLSASYYSAGARKTAAVGAYPITATLNDPDSRLHNYNFTVYNSQLTVTPLFLFIPVIRK